MSDGTKKGREITGKHVLIGFVAAFGVIIAVNLIMAFSAVKTFPGLEVKNSYVASQEFDKRKALQEALGWSVSARHEGEELVLSITDRNGNPVEVKELNAILGRPTSVKEDVEPEFRFNGSAYVAPLSLQDGNWDVRMVAYAADGTEFRKRVKMEFKK
ncbi:FixH family protein [Alisedimentitalea sp. MJ-SS2]|uniref:FixH family protein n=1 Tax=Aliisedimentitalea sp. MJ-SS2 TaxID=3049795 RepID=UPI0029088CC5|nr:FixH family protein [Alisedimentitalea sp. MJ-SS2]MDU8928124.1 FixH family protein [Alisedimentitalea sp. MJ-SS2]